jgi:leucyl-tRNA synthetase
VSSRPYPQIPPTTSQPSLICGKAPILQIDPKWVSVDSIPVLTTLTYSGLTAPRLVEMLKIQSQKDVKQLAEAKEIAYKEEFYSGVMSVGECSGSPVQEAEPKARASMIGIS